MLLNGLVSGEICQGMGMFPDQGFDLLELDDLGLPGDYQLTEQSIPRFNDVNADGLPDIMTIMQANGYDKVVILLN